MINDDSKGKKVHHRPAGLSLDQLQSVMASTEKSLDDLNHKNRILPKVEKDGSSECPFAEDLYADKEEAAQKLTKRLQELRSFLPQIDEKIARFKSNLNRIDNDGKAISYDKAKDEYHSAKRAQESKYNKALQQKKDVLELLKKGKEMLKKANAKKYPGKKPKKAFRPPPILPKGVLPPIDIPNSLYPGKKIDSSVTSPKTGLDDLISIGPLTRRPF